MRISFIILFMIDLYKDNHVCAMRVFVNFLCSPERKVLRVSYCDSAVSIVRFAGFPLGFAFVAICDRFCKVAQENA